VPDAVVDAAAGSAWVAVGSVGAVGISFLATARPSGSSPAAAGTVATGFATIVPDSLRTGADAGSGDELVGARTAPRPVVGAMIVGRSGAAAEAEAEAEVEVEVEVEAACGVADVEATSTDAFQRNAGAGCDCESPGRVAGR